MTDIPTLIGQTLEAARRDVEAQLEQLDAAGRVEPQLRQVAIAKESAKLAALSERLSASRPSRLRPCWCPDCLTVFDDYGKTINRILEIQ